MSTCLICANPEADKGEFHSNCLRELFGSEVVPDLDYNLDELTELAKKAVHQRVTIPGVQAKLSLEIDRQTRESSKLTIVGLWGKYILKPPSVRWNQLPENEHCTMMMAEAVGIETVSFGLIRLASGERSYITRRIDRDEGGNKFAMEDMCQLTGRLTEDKYKGSHEQIAKVIKKYSENPVFDLIRLFEIVLFSYLTGNSDMHLKNFSLFKDPELGWKMAPGYDFLSTRLVIPAEKDPEELCLTLIGKKNNFQAQNFKEFGSGIGLNRKQVENAMDRIISKKAEINNTINQSFLSSDLKQSYHDIIEQRFGIL